MPLKAYGMPLQSNGMLLKANGMTVEANGLALKSNGVILKVKFPQGFRLVRNRLLSCTAVYYILHHTKDLVMLLCVLYLCLLLRLHLHTSRLRSYELYNLGISSFRY